MTVQKIVIRQYTVDRPQPLLEVQHPSNNRFAEVAGGTTAKCAAVCCCCCCPFAFMNLLVLAVYGVPAGLFRKALRKRRRRRLLKKGLLFEGGDVADGDLSSHDRSSCDEGKLLIHHSIRYDVAELLIDHPPEMELRYHVERLSCFCHGCLVPSLRRFDIVQGLANPVPIIQTFYAEDQIFNDVKFGGVVTLVDAKHANIHLDDIKPKGIVNEGVEQIVYADRIIVNKTDLLGTGEVAALVQRIKSINRMAELKRTEIGKVDLDYVLGIGGFDLERIDAAIEDEATKEDEHNHSHEHDHDHDHENCHDHDHDHHHHDHDHKHEHHDHTHDPGVSSVSIVFERSLDLEKANF